MSTSVKLPKSTRFSRLTEVGHRSRLVVMLEGLPKHGKTHLALTAPGPILYQDIENGLEGVVDQFIASGKEIWPASYTPATGDVGEDQGLSQEQAAAEFKAFHADFYAGLRSGARAIVWDTASELWELVQLAEFGKLNQNNKYNYRGINTIMRKMIRAAVDSDVSLIMLHRLKKKYVAEKWDGTYEFAGFNGSPFEAQAIIRSYRCSGDCDADDHAEGATNFHMKIMDCRHNPELNGQDLPSPLNTFPTLAMMVFGQDDTSEWE